MLFAAYATFSWFLTHWFLNAGAAWIAVWASWAFVLMLTLLQALLLTTWFDGMKLFFRRWLKSDVGYFSLIIVGALSVTVALVWFRIFGYFLVVVASEVLARLDLQNYSYTRWQALLVLTLVSLLGLAVGWSASFNPLFQLAS
jgi:hypothetical protein